jgi:hypothetical protein
MLSVAVLVEDVKVCRPAVDPDTVYDLPILLPWSASLLKHRVPCQLSSSEMHHMTELRAIFLASHSLVYAEVDQSSCTSRPGGVERVGAVVWEEYCRIDGRGEDSDCGSCLA